MLQDLRAQLLQYGVPRALLNSFEQAVRTELTTRYQATTDAAERREMSLSDAASTWRVKYMREHEKAQKLELVSAVKDERLKLAQKAIANLSAYIKQCRKEIFGSKSERGASGAASQASPEVSVPESGGRRGKRPGTRGHGRKRDCGPVVVPVEHDIDAHDKFCRCGEEFDLTDLEPVRSYETHYEEKVVVREHIRRKVVRRCPKCGRRPGIKTAKKPPKLIAGGKYSTETWRHILEEKYWLQRPLNRVCKKLKSLQVTVRLGTLTNGLAILYRARIFEVVYEAILDRSRLAEQRHMDETGWRVFAETEDKQSSRWYMWVSVTVDATVFVLDPRRSTDVITEHLNGVAEGIIICDRFSSYKCFGKNNSGFLIAFCWVHQRRDFVKLKDGFPAHASWSQDWLARIDALMAQNKVRVAASNQSEQFKAQDNILRKMVAEMQKTVELQLADTSLAEEQIARLQSLQVHWTGLTVFVDHPHVPMDNNEAERALREAVLGRKSYYGSRAVWSGQQTAWLFTIYATLEQNGIDPHRWMGDYLKACAKNNGLPPRDKDLSQFLPWNYKHTAPPLALPQSDNVDEHLTVPPPEPFRQGDVITISVLPELQPSSLAKPPPTA